MRGFILSATTLHEGSYIAIYLHRSTYRISSITHRRLIFFSPGWNQRRQFEGSVNKPQRWQHNVVVMHNSVLCTTLSLNGASNDLFFVDMLR